MPPLQLSVNFVGNWTCETCCEDYNTYDDGSQPWQTTDDDEVQICSTCIRGQFEQAVRHDYSWPARYGAQQLQVRDFESILPPQLVITVLRKELEVATQQPDKAVLQEIIDTQIRGKDYQICPGCDKIITLRDGCNHIICVLCLPSFCYICGNKALDGTDHWTHGACPRYGQPGSRQAIFDHPEADDEDEVLGEMITVEEEMQRLRHHWAGFHFDVWTWNVAMQSSTPGPVREAMHRLLHADQWVPTPAEAALLTNAFNSYNPLHTVSREQWDADVGFRQGRPNAFTLGPPTRQEEDDEIQSRFLEIDLLKQPVGGVFNMAAEHGRRAAFMWLHNTIRDYDSIHRDTSKITAIFDMGPGGDFTSRLAVVDMLFELWMEGNDRSRMRFTFDKLHTALLVTVNPPNAMVMDEEVVYTVSHWRMMLLHEFYASIIYLDGERNMNREEPAEEEWVALYGDAAMAWRRQGELVGGWVF